jgi:hypothetical protein
MKGIDCLCRYVWCEWIKRRRSLGSWVVIVGATFTPAIILVARLVNARVLPDLYARDDFWQSLWKSSWESMAVFFAPMACILIPSLVTQIEYRSNGWKQVRSLPLSSFELYSGKLAIILALVVQLFALFDLAVYLSGVIPCVLPGVPYPRGAFPLGGFLNDTGRYLLSSLPVVTAEYMLSLQFKNFLVPIGIGFMTWVGALAGLSSRYGYLIPYSYSMMDYLRTYPKSRIPVVPMPLDWLAMAYSTAFAVAGYVLFVRKSAKG